MKKRTILLSGSIVCLVLLGLCFTSFRQVVKQEPWQPSQLLQPADLAQTINDPLAKKPVIFSVGPGAVIRGSVNIGPARDSANLAKLQQQLAALPKDAAVVVYCGCCPFEHCPNVRPAFTLLKQLQFSQAKLLNLEHNVKVDWIDKGYPLMK